MTEPLKVVKLAYYMPLARGVCDCGGGLWYNLALPYVAHDPPVLMCLDPYPVVPSLSDAFPGDAWDE